MALSTYLDKSTLYANYGVSQSDMPDTFIDRVITKTNSLLDKKFGGLFELTASQTDQYRNKPSHKIIATGIWQESDGTPIVVKKGRDGDSSLTTLTEGDNFRFIRYDEVAIETEYPDAIIGIRLYNSELRDDRSFIQLEGTQGLTSTIPDELYLDDYLYDLIIKAAYINKSTVATEGGGQLIESRIDKVVMKFADTSEEQAPQLRTVAGTLKYISSQINQIAASYTPDLLSAELLG